jgi:hypothetical protein
MTHMTVMSGAEWRRKWSCEQKRAIVAEAFSPGSSVSAVARREDVCTGLIFRWWKDLQSGGSPPSFSSVVLIAEPAVHTAWIPAIRGLALGRRAWLFCGSDRGGQRAARMYSLFVTCKMNNVDGQAWHADVLARIADHPAHRIEELMPWNWRPASSTIADDAS